MKDLSKSLQNAATKAITTFDSAYFDAGGINDIERALDDKKVGVSAHIYKLAKQACKAEKQLADGAKLFRAACTYAEEAYKELHDITNVAQRLPAWSQFKSRILRAMKVGLDPREYGSERMLRDAFATQNVVPMIGADTGEPNDVQTWLAKTGVHSTLQITLTRVVLEAEYVRADRRAEAERILQKAAKKLSKLVDKERITSDATRSAIRVEAA